LTTSDISDLIEVANPDAHISDEAVESLARLLLVMIEREEQENERAGE
jgi:hypothetical protein